MKINPFIQDELSSYYKHKTILEFIPNLGFS